MAVMVGPGGASAYPPPASAHLLPLALSRPNDALDQARALLAAHPGPFDASVAHQTVGIVLRDYGDVGAAIGELRTAVRLARASGAPDREVDALATLGGSLVLGGRTKPGLAALDAAVRRSSGVLAGRVLMRRAGILGVLGRHHEALDDLRRAVTALRRGGDRLWEARALNHRAFIHLSLGSTDRAQVDIERCEALFSEIGQELELAFARHNRGLIAFRAGDLPAALGYLDEAAQRYQALEAPIPDLAIDRCAVLLAAGLPREALNEADGAIRALDDVNGQPARKAELLLSAATSALAAEDPRTALDRAQAAYRLFGAQQRPWWRAHARLLVLQARHAAGACVRSSAARLPRQAAEVAARLDELGSMEAPRGYLLAGRAALALGRAAEADRHLAAASRLRRRGPALSRATGWLAEALRAEAAGEPRRLLRACRRGLDVLDEHLLTLGDRPVSVAPSASVWLRARKAPVPGRRDVVLVVGPGLAEGGAEVAALIGRYGDVTVLGGGTATAERVLAAMDGAWLVHVAAHGTFRADSPLFSSLRIDDGPLTVHDLERLRRPPYRMVLASCDSGLLVPAGADELLGLTTSLVALGTVGIVASVVPVADAAATRLMLALHERLAGCGTLAEALSGARRDLGDDPVLVATGWSFVALGAG